jgi:hypothetical protein
MTRPRPALRQYVVARLNTLLRDAVQKESVHSAIEDQAAAAIKLPQHHTDAGMSLLISERCA